MAIYFNVCCSFKHFFIKSAVSQGLELHSESPYSMKRKLLFLYCKIKNVIGQVEQVNFYVNAILLATNF